MQAVVLKKIPIKEYDQLVVCYTKDFGKQTYNAKSVLRPTSRQAGHLDVLNLADFYPIQGNGHPIITSAYCLKSFRHLKSSLSAMTVAFFLLEAFDKLVFENEPDTKLWNFLYSRLNAFDEKVKNKDHEIDWLSVIIGSRAELLEVLGYSKNTSIEELANAQFKSLQFARKVLK